MRKPKHESKWLIESCMYRVSKFVELSDEMSVAFFSTLNVTLNSTINDTEFFENFLFHLNYYFF